MEDKRYDFVRVLWQNRENPLEHGADVSKDKPGRGLTLAGLKCCMDGC